jgi:hypothetical protein
MLQKNLNFVRKSTAPARRPEFVAVDTERRLHYPRHEWLGFGGANV